MKYKIPFPHGLWKLLATRFIQKFTSPSLLWTIFTISSGALTFLTVKDKLGLFYGILAAPIGMIIGYCILYIPLRASIAFLKLLVHWEIMQNPEHDAEWKES